ncbi:class I glutamine amidotransferase [Lecanosticta acicola]|uniref:D-lactate dehydratase n=1 Tax=Lecanosticta acicola TaxID=111012 RepID=A0AAI8YYL8_9PEZI|nr:class I glutamine amidotransferase [Lecanosticta acicola]
MSGLIDKAKQVLHHKGDKEHGKPKVLFVLTSHKDMGTTGKPTGWYLPEFAHPYYKLEGKADIVIASPKGGEAPLDPASVEMFKEDAEATKFLKEKETLWKHTEKLGDFLGKAEEFDAIFYVGGHGPMFDLATDEKSHQLIREFYEKGKVVSAVCHGPAALAYVKLADGTYLIKDQEVTGFTNTEEDQVGLSSAMPFLLETVLETNGGKVVKTEPWGPKVATGRGGKLITGQNPASAAPIGEAILKAIESH